jgi:predicted metal-binding membrane protein
LNLLRRQRVVILAALAAIAALAWLYLFLAAGDMTAAMAGMDRTMVMPPRGPIELVLLFAMWWVMMVGMMLPGVTPMILTFATVNRNRRARGEPYVPSALFAAGYLLAWGAFSLAATLVQEGLERAALLSPMDMTTDSRLLGGVLFLAAGLYQFTPVKLACLRFCRSPLDFVVNHWRDGPAGALRMGITHGLYCLGCCWTLMLLLFVGGVMNLLWAAVLAIVVLIEKLTAGPWIGRAGGALLVAYGTWLLAYGTWLLATY